MISTYLDTLPTQELKIFIITLYYFQAKCFNHIIWNADSTCIHHEFFFSNFLVVSYNSYSLQLYCLIWRYGKALSFTFLLQIMAYSDNNHGAVD